MRTARRQAGAAPTQTARSSSGPFPHLAVAVRVPGSRALYAAHVKSCPCKTPTRATPVQYDYFWGRNARTAYVEDAVVQARGGPFSAAAHAPVIRSPPRRTGPGPARRPQGPRAGNSQNPDAGQ